MASAWSRGSTPATSPSCGPAITYNVGDVAGYHSTVLHTRGHAPHRQDPERAVHVQGGQQLLARPGSSPEEPADRQARAPCPARRHRAGDDAESGTVSRRRTDLDSRRRHRRGTAQRQAEERNHVATRSSAWARFGLPQNHAPAVGHRGGHYRCCRRPGPGPARARGDRPDRHLAGQDAPRASRWSSPTAHRSARAPPTTRPPRPHRIRSSASSPTVVDVHFAYTRRRPATMAVGVEVSNGLGWRSSWQLAPATASERQVRTSRPST